MILRPYQLESIESLRQGMREGHIRQVLCAATGAGKSVIMLSMIDSATQKQSRAMFICERRILVEQFSKHLDSIGVDHGVLMAKHWRFKPQALVQVASAQTLEKMESLPAFDVCFIDEIHACMRKSIVDMIKARPNLRIIGATATPFHPAIAEHFTAITNVITMEQLIAAGNLVPFRVFISHEIDTSGIKVVAGEWKKDDLEVRGRAIVGDIVSDYLRLTSDVFGGTRKTICFSCGVAHGTELAQKFNDAGINAVQISYKDTDDYKAEVLAEFAKPDSGVQMVISSDILTRGFDQSDVEHVILARPLKKSFSSFVQMVGRGARPHEGKEFCLIQDHSGNWLRFRKSWDELFSNGVHKLESSADKESRKEPTEREKQAAKCPRCTALWVGKSDTCSCCGFVRPVVNRVQALPGEMQELTAKERKSAKETPEFKADFYAQLLGYCQEHGKNPGMAYHRFKDRFGVYPSMAKPEPKTPSYGVENWMRSRNIAFAKAKAKQPAGVAYAV